MPLVMTIVLCMSEFVRNVIACMSKLCAIKMMMSA